MLNVHEIFWIILFVVGILALLLILLVPSDFDYLSLFLKHEIFSDPAYYYPKQRN